MRLAFIINLSGEYNNITNTVYNITKQFSESNIYLSTTTTADTESQWQNVEILCTPCCGNQDKIDETTENYRIISRNNIHGIKYNSGDPITQTVNFIKNNYDLIFILRSDIEIWESSILKYLDAIKQEEVGAVYSDFDDEYLRAFSAIYKIDTSKIHTILVKTKYIEDCDDMSSLIGNVYNKSIIRHIPENLYSLKK